MQLTGDIDDSTTLTVFAPNSASQISWNGVNLKTTKTGVGSLTASLNAPNSNAFTLPSLTSWKANDSLPERLPSYDDSGLAWVGELTILKQLLKNILLMEFPDANNMTTDNPTPPASLPVLYVDQYG